MLCLHFVELLGFEEQGGVKYDPEVFLKCQSN